MVKVKLKEGLTSIASAYYELNPGIITEVPDRLFNPEIMDKVLSKADKTEKKEEKPKKKVDQPKAEKPKVEKSFRDELIDLPGIGPKIAEQILNMAKTKEGLAKIPRKTLIDEIRDDAVIVLDQYLGR